MIVLDACSAIAVAMDTPEGNGMMNLIVKHEKIIAPELFKAEIRNGFFKYVHAGKMTKEQAETNIDVAEGLVEQFVPIDENANEAFVAACVYDHPVYDMFYMTLARRYNATLYTLDRRLMDTCRRARVDCLHLMNLSEGNPEEA